MEINLIPEPTGGAPLGVADYNYQNALQQALHGMNEYNNILTEWETTTEPEIALGARFVHDGGLYECQTANEVIAGAPADGHVYIKATEAAGVITVAFVTSDAGYTYNPIKGGWYHADGTQLLPYLLLKYDSTYWKKAKPIIANLNETSDLSSCQIYPHAAMETIVQDNSKDCLLLPAGVTYFDFSSPNLFNSANVSPTIKFNVEWKNSLDANCFFNNRGISYINAGFAVYNYTFGNEMQIGIRIKPNFAYNVAAPVRIFVNGPLTATLNDSIFLFYDDTIDKWRLLVVDDVPNNYYAINSNQYLNNAALQVETTFFIKISKANNNVDMWINGIKQDGVGAGTKTLTGTIAGINITATRFWLGADYLTLTEWYTAYTVALFYIQDILLTNSYGETYLANFDASSDLPYYKMTYLPLQQHAALIDINGNAGFSKLCSETITTNSIDSGAGQIKIKKLPTGVWDMNGSAFITVAHGVSDWTKIKDIHAMVTDDAGTTRYNLCITNNLAFGGGISWDATNITLWRYNGGANIFSGASFNDGTINRGLIYIEMFI